MYAAPADLNDVHKAQISRLTSFYKGRREKALQDRASEKEDFKTDNNLDDARLFNKQEMDQMIDYYHHQLTLKVKDDLEHTASLAAVYSSIIMGQAEQMGVTLHVEDISIIEDRNRIDQVSSIATIQGAPPPLPRVSQQLPSLGAPAAADPRVLQELADVREEKNQMEARYLTMQSEMSNLLKERSGLSEELEKMKANFQQLIGDVHATNPSVLENQSAIEVQRLLDQTKGNLDQKSAECEQIRHELNTRLSDSAQFRDIKAIVKKKSDEVKQLRAILTQYGIELPAAADGCLELQADSD